MRLGHCDAGREVAPSQFPAVKVWLDCVLDISPLPHRGFVTLPARAGAGAGKPCIIVLPTHDTTEGGPGRGRTGDVASCGEICGWQRMATQPSILPPEHPSSARAGERCFLCARDSSQASPRYDGLGTVVPWICRSCLLGSGEERVGASLLFVGRGGIMFVCELTRLGAGHTGATEARSPGYNAACSEDGAWERAAVCITKGKMGWANVCCFIT